MRRITSGSRAGFTLIEIICALVLLGMLVLFGSLGFLEMIRGYVITENNMASVVDTDIFKTMHIRLSRIYRIDSISSHKIVYFVLQEDNGKVKEVKRSLSFPADAGIDVKYLKKDGKTPANKNDVRYIQVSRTIKVGEKTEKKFTMRIAPYHLQYRNQQPLEGE